MYQRILVPVDGSAASAQALTEAIELARHLETRIKIVHVVEPWIMVTPETMPATVHQIAENIRRIGAELLEDCKGQVAKAGVEVDVELVETTGAPTGECILNKVNQFDADLIVCGTHGRRGLHRMLMGSDAEYIVRRSPVPVLLVRNQQVVDPAA